MRCVLIECCVAVLLAGVALGHDLGSISGTVEDEHGVPVLGATVVAEPLDVPMAMLRPSTTTDDHGHYTIAQLEYGRYFVSASKPEDARPLAKIERSQQAEQDLIDLWTYIAADQRRCACALIVNMCDLKDQFSRRGRLSERPWISCRSIVAFLTATEPFTRVGSGPPCAADRLEKTFEVVCATGWPYGHDVGPVLWRGQVDTDGFGHSDGPNWGGPASECMQCDLWWAVEANRQNDRPDSAVGVQLQWTDLSQSSRIFPR